MGPWRKAEKPVYLDAAATTRTKPPEVYDAVDHFMREVGALSGRSVHGPGLAAGRIVAEARESLASLLGVSDSSRIIFTHNCTEALNLAIIGTLHEGDRVVVGPFEHNAVMRPLSAMARLRNVTIATIPYTMDRVDPDAVRKCLEPGAALLVMMHASNVTGAIQPIAECGAIASELGVPFLVDAAQTAGSVPISLAELPVDMLAFSGHKSLLGPQGVGGLYIGPDVNPEPLKYGGTGSASEEIIQPDIMPDRYEGGTMNGPGLAGLGAAAGFLAERTIENVREHVMGLVDIMIEGLSDVDRLSLYSPRGERNAGVFSFRLKDRDPAETALELEREYLIFTRVGLHCAPTAHRALGTFPTGAVRASVSCFTSRDEVIYFVESMRRLCEK